MSRPKRSASDAELGEEHVDRIESALDNIAKRIGTRSLALGERDVCEALDGVASAVSGINAQSDTSDLVECFRVYRMHEGFRTVIGELCHVTTALERIATALEASDSTSDTNFSLRVVGNSKTTIARASVDWTVGAVKRHLNAKKKPPHLANKLSIKSGCEGVSNVPLDDDTRTLRSYGVCNIDTLVSSE